MTATTPSVANPLGALIADMLAETGEPDRDDNAWAEEALRIARSEIHGHVSLELPPVTHFGNLRL